ncbi:MAG: hypothetical protein ACXABV_05315 [Candidatus Thorarchaeota archaeon]|jgi:hypothetical protein
MARIKAEPTSRLISARIILSSPLQSLQVYLTPILGILVMIVLLYPLTILPGLIMAVLPAEIYLADKIYTGFTSRTPLLELIELGTPLDDLEDTRARTAGGRPPNAADGKFPFTK